MKYLLPKGYRRISAGYEYGCALNKDRCRQMFSDSYMLYALDRCIRAKSKKDMKKWSGIITEQQKKEKEIHDEMRKILD